MSLPSRKIADPMPVPKVTKMMTPLRPLPAPNRISATPAASASLTTVTGPPTCWEKSAAAFVPTQEGSTFGSGVGDTVFDDRGKGHSGRTSIIVEVRRDLLDDVSHRIWHRRLRSLDPKALRNELACFHVNWRAFDSGSTDVYSKKRHNIYPPVSLLENRTRSTLREN